MANLIKDINKNERLKRMQVMKAAEALPMPDPMIGYEREKQPQERIAPAGLEPTTPASVNEKPQAGGEVQPVHEPAKDTTSTAPAVEADKSIPNEDQASATEGHKNTDNPSSAGRTKPRVKDDVMLVKLTYRFSEAHAKRAEAIAQHLGVKPEVILLKTVQAVVLEDEDFREGGEDRRNGPLVRRDLKVPKKKAEAWIAAQDPLGVFARPGVMLRQVAYNALDRAAEKVLPELEAKRRNAG